MTTWSEFKNPINYSRLGESISVDVVIIGGGITGILNAYYLSKEGKKIAVIEKGTLGSFATLATTAFLTRVIDSDLKEIESIFGEDTAEKVWSSHQSAIEEFEKLINREESIECEFVRCSDYVYAATKRQMEEIKTEWKEYRRKNINANLHKEGDVLGFVNFGYMEVLNQAKFNPAKFLYTLAERAVGRGGKIFENTEALDIRTEKSGRILVETSGGNITAAKAIVSTYKPLTNKKTHLKKGMYRSYVFEVSVPAGSFPEGIYEDNRNPYYYFRIDKKGGESDRMIIGGEDHKDIFGNALVDKSFNGLEKYLKKIMNGRPYSIVKKWYGPILEPSDGLPLIGEISSNIFVATAFSGNGMTYSMISALILRDLILENDNPWAGVYTPNRALFHPKRLAAKAKDYAEEFFGGAMKNMLS